VKKQREKLKSVSQIVYLNDYHWGRFERGEPPRVCFPLRDGVYQHPIELTFSVVTDGTSAPEPMDELPLDYKDGAGLLAINAINQLIRERNER